MVDKARWSEAVTEYGKVDELEKLFVIKNRINQYGETKKSKPEISLKSMFINVSYASESVDTIYPINPNEKVDVMSCAKSLHRTICYEEKLNQNDLNDASKVNLYKVDFSLLEDSEVKREYVINIVSGMLYWLEPVHYQRLDYHTPRYGVIHYEEQPESKLTIHYSSGYPEGDPEYTQDVSMHQSSSVILDPNQFTRENYHFFRWKDVTNEHITEAQNDIEELEDDEGEGFEKRIDGYFGVANNLITILGKKWESQVIDLIDQNKDNLQNQKDDIWVYVIGEDEGNVKKILTSDQSIDELIDWMLENTEYLSNLENDEEDSYDEYEQTKGDEIGDTTEETEDREEEYVYYADQEENVDMSGMHMWLEAEWSNAIVTLNANGGEINGKASDVIGVQENIAYGSSLKDAVRDEYEFAGWWTEVSGGIQIVDTDEYHESNLIGNTLYAHWDKSNIATITYDANGSTVKDANKLDVKIMTQRKVIGTKMGNMPKASEAWRISF